MRSYFYFCFFKQKTAYEMRISDWSSDVCSSDLQAQRQRRAQQGCDFFHGYSPWTGDEWVLKAKQSLVIQARTVSCPSVKSGAFVRSEEHTSELQSLMRISYAVFCLKKKKINVCMTHILYI